MPLAPTAIAIASPAVVGRGPLCQQLLTDSQCCQPSCSQWRLADMQAARTIDMRCMLIEQPALGCIAQPKVWR
jgi:hypothetical protein